MGKQFYRPFHLTVSDPLSAWLGFQPLGKARTATLKNDSNSREPHMRIERYALVDKIGQAADDFFLVELSFAKAGAISAALQPEELHMDREIKMLGAPRIQVALSLADEAKMTAAGTRGPFNAWLIFDLPDGKPPATIPLAGGPFIQDEAMLLLETIWTFIGEKFADS